MEIKPTYVTFEQGKLLADVDYPVTNECFNEEGKPCVVSLTARKLLDDVYYPRPQQWEVVEWLRLNHNIWIYVLSYSTLFRPYAEELIDKDRFGKWEGHKYDTPQDAYSAAFDYILTNLI